MIIIWNLRIIIIIIIIKYNIEVENRFEASGDIEDPEEEHDMILETYRDAPKKVIGWSKKQERKGEKLTMESARSEL